MSDAWETLGSDTSLVHRAADELPVLPHVDWATAAKYGLAKFKELFTRQPAES